MSLRYVTVVWHCLTLSGFYLYFKKGEAYWDLIRLILLYLTEILGWMLKKKCLSPIQRSNALSASQPFLFFFYFSFSLMPQIWYKTGRIRKEKHEWSLCVFFSFFVQKYVFHSHCSAYIHRNNMVDTSTIYQEQSYAHMVTFKNTKTHHNLTFLTKRHLAAIYKEHFYHYSLTDGGK